MKCQILFSRNNKKNISLSFAEFAHSMVSIKQYNDTVTIYINKKKKQTVNSMQTLLRRIGSFEQLDVILCLCIKKSFFLLN